MEETESKYEKRCAFILSMSQFPELKTVERFLLTQFAILSEIKNGEFQSLKISIDDLSVRTCLSTKTIDRTLKLLVDRDFINRQKLGYGMVSSYRIASHVQSAGAV